MVQKTLGIIGHAYAQPLFATLKKNNFFKLLIDQPAQLSIKLRQNDVDGAFLSPVDYGKNYSLYKIIPDVAAVSSGRSNTILLYFNENSRKIGSVAFDPAFTTETVLASLILSEKYDSRPKLIPVSAGADEALNIADGFLAVGDAALKNLDRPNRIDLVDEWFDLTEMPFVHGFWTAREERLTKDEIVMIMDKSRNIAPQDEELQYFKYQMDDESVASLNEFYRMAYYHGILRDIPDLKFFELG